MKNVFPAAIAALAFAVTAIPASAAPREGPIEWSDAPRSQRELHEFAACVAAGETRQARAVLAMDYRTPEYNRAMMRLLQGGRYCLHHSRLGGNLRFFAGRIAEALLVRSLRGGALAQRVAHDPAMPPIQARDETELMAFCTVRAAPAQVAALFATRPTSAEEVAAIHALTPQVAQCLPAGATGHFNRAALRSILDLAAYRLSAYNSPAQSASIAGPNLQGSIAR